MKRQQLFDSFWPGLTAAVAITQSVWADTVPVNAVQLNPITKSNQLQTDSAISQKQTQNVVEPTRRNDLPDKRGTSTTVNPSSTNSNTRSQGAPGASSTPIPGVRSLSIDSDNRSQSVPSTSPGLTYPAGSSSQSPPPPSYLNPGGNPLQFPTRPEEVQIQGTQPITLQQAFELARRNSRTLQVAELTLERSRSALRQQQAALLPTLTTTQGINRSLNAGDRLRTIQSQQAVRNDIDPNNDFSIDSASASTAYGGDLTLSYDVYTSGARAARIRQAEEQVRFDQLGVEVELESLRQNVSNDYYNLQGGDQQVRISQEAVRNAQASLRDAVALEQAGVGTRFEVLQAQVQLANRTQELTNALSQQRIFRRQLATRISLAQTVDISAAEPVQIAGLWNLSLEDSIIVAFKNRAELEQQLALRNQSEQRRRLALAALGPQFRVSASYSLADPFDDRFSVEDGYAVGGTVSLSIFEGGAARATAEQEERNIEIAEANFADTRNQIRFQIEQGYSELQSNFANIQTATTGLEQARESLRLARLRFQAGVGTQTDVINQENALVQAEGNRITAILDYNRALATLQRAITSGPPR